MKFRALFTLPILTISILCIVLFLIPGSLGMMAFSGKMLANGQLWRLLTFPFVHVDLTHLIENIVILALTTFLAYEIELTPKQIVLAFMGSSVLLALTNMFFIPTLIIAGASAGIYALLGLLSMKGSRFVSAAILVPVISSSVFFKYLFTTVLHGGGGETLLQTLLHLQSFIHGLLLFLVIKAYRESTKIRKKVLTYDYELPAQPVKCDYKG